MRLFTQIWILGQEMIKILCERGAMKADIL
jgi:hypothetical protein